MKKILFPIFAMLLLLSAAAIAADNSITLTYQLIDSEISPGGETTLILTMTNPSSSQPINSIRLYITGGKYVFASPSYIDVGGLAPSASQQTSFVIKADSSAISGTDYITIRADYIPDSIQKETSINIPIKIIRKPMLQITKTSYSVTPKPGNETLLTLSVMNNGAGDAEDVLFSLNKSDLFTAENYEYFAREIKAGSVASIPFTLDISPSASTGTYSISLVLKYFDESRQKNFTESKTIPLNIEGSAKLSIANIKTDPSKIISGSDTTLTVLIENSGTADAKSVSASIDLPFQGTKTAFLGKIGPDEDAPAVFNLQAGKAGNYNYTLAISYEDDFGAHEYKQGLNFIVYNAGVSGVAIVLTAVVIIGAAYFAYSRLRRK